MEKLEAALVNEGYQVVNLGYPSREHPIEELAELAVGDGLAACPEEAGIYFVTHSLGGILVRQYLANHTIERLQSVVMLGPPNQGSEVVDKLGGVPGFFWLNGPAGLQLGTDKESVPKRLGEADFDLGIIAGNRTINFILSLLIPGPDDGKVAVAHTKLVGMNEHLVMPTSHPFMMNNDAVIEQVLFYLRHGRFDVTSETPDAP